MRFSTIVAAAATTATLATADPIAPQFLCLYKTKDDCKNKKVAAVGDCRPISLKNLAVDPITDKGFIGIYPVTDALKLNVDNLWEADVNPSCENAAPLAVDTKNGRNVAALAIMDKYSDYKKGAKKANLTVMPKRSVKDIEGIYGENYSSVLSGEEVCKLEGAETTTHCGGKDAPKTKVFKDSAASVATIGAAIALAAIALRA